MSDDVRFDEAAITLLNRVGGEQLTGKMTALFSANAPTRLAAADIALAAEDRTAGAAAAHSLKSSAGQLGAIRLQHLCENLEAAFEDGDVTRASSLLAEAHLELAATLDWLTQRAAL